jgi:hypothetical protein
VGGPCLSGVMYACVRACVYMHETAGDGEGCVLCDSWFPRFVSTMGKIDGRRRVGWGVGCGMWDVGCR